jgi:hypothetical protein
MDFGQIIPSFYHNILEHCIRYIYLKLCSLIYDSQKTEIQKLTKYYSYEKQITFLLSS